MKAKGDNIKPSRRDVVDSLIITLGISLNLISPVARERMTSVADCEPALPPVSVSNGIKNDKAITEANTFL